jgi:hypothetical protein
VLAETRDRPSRVLVITDSLDFGPLVAAGVGFEHVPARDEPQAEGSGLSYSAFVRRRIGLILAERRRPRRALALGNQNPRLLEAITAPKRHRRVLLGA